MLPSLLRGDGRLDESLTIDRTFFALAEAHGPRPLLIAPANPARDYDPAGRSLSYAESAALVRQLAQRYAEAGYGQGHRIALFVENRLEHLLHKLAMNALGVCCVPVNPDYRPRELAYLIDHAQIDLVVVLQARLPELAAACAESVRQPAIVILEDFAQVGPPPAAQPAKVQRAGADVPACILYTSGTTGRPKGCVLSHRYELAAGEAYATRGGMAQLREGGERIYNPLPLFHVNASILSFQGAMLTGNSQVQTDRFRPTRWWIEIRESGATVAHYLGVIIQMLHAAAVAPDERDHSLRFGIGAGVEPQIHAAFEARFGFPLLELWGMTEMVRVMIACHPPRQVGTRAFGRALPGVEACVVDDAGQAVSDGTPGEMLIRHSGDTPRKDFFSAYLDDPTATEEAWRGGWFHTGDVVVRDDTGMFHFVDRRKNIIRRSGENIAAAEVEAWLITHPWIEQAAVMAVPDDLREEEVLACIALSAPGAARLAEDAKAVLAVLFEHCREGLAYFKAPGWIWFAKEIPTTGTQKIQKHAIFGPGVDPRGLPGIHDLRARKRRSAHEGAAT